jgi:phosphate:Na+ symporter
MNILNLMAPLLSGLGLFFIGVRLLSANLVPLVGRRARAAFAGALRGPASSALSGLAAGLLTQSSTAVSWIILGLIRAGLPATAWVLVAPAWANVGTALLPILVAVNLATSVSLVIGLVGFATYFKLDNTDRRRYALDAALGAALLLFGMQIVSSSVGPVREALISNGVLAFVIQTPILLALIGIFFSLITQSSSVAAAIAVAGVNNGLLTIVSALPLIAGANAAGILNNALKLRGETAIGLSMFCLQILQKAAGSILLVAIAIAAATLPAAATMLASHHPSGQIATIFTIAQLAGAAIAALAGTRVTAWFAVHYPPGAAESLASPHFLLRESLNDPPVALSLANREIARLTARVPALLDHVRASPDLTAPSAVTLRDAGISLATAIKSYLLNLLDNHPGRDQVAAALLLENATGSIAGLHEALADIAAAAPDAASLPAAGRLIESLHALLSFIADHAASLGADDPDFLLRMLGDRNAMMTELRQRLSADDADAPAQDALFRISMLFERAVWLGRRFVTDLAQAHALLKK